MNQPTSRPGGDFSFDIMEEFRAAYAQQLASPNEDEVANNTGLPTNTVANTSPWYDHVGLWKYPSGKGTEDNLKEVFDPNDFLPQNSHEEDYEEDEESQMTDEELENLIQELLNGGEDEEE